MKKWITIIIIFLMVVFAAGCVSEPKTKTYNANGVSFKYPEDWNIDYNEIKQLNSSSLLVNLKSRDNNSGVTVTKEKLNTTINEYANNFYQTYSENYDILIISNKTRLINGINALEINRRFSNTQESFYYSTKLIKRDNYIYSIEIQCSEYDKRPVDIILNSFKFTN
ncbi:PsbP-related protein [Methanobacterium sp. ACI-7]|uniref:PsbP-related protein n=1 Tax=unclassified Methanobacterium TaxID=2627676 RepID=UPI0039C2A2EC